MTGQEPVRILVVDDSRDGADSLGLVLQMMGAHVRVVYHGQSALDAMAEFHPAVVLLDIGMPEMDGHEVARRIRAQPPLHPVRLIALTGWGTDEDRRQTVASGFDEHWVKPVEPDRLKSLVQPPAAGAR